ncbi:hypothetical protein FRB96_007410 [Tulasnella sp. 330]|nr:hypothetical protein FRB96_007410 [Tulasnella sp. 330]
MLHRITEDATTFPTQSKALIATLIRYFRARTFRWRQSSAAMVFAVLLPAVYGLRLPISSRKTDTSHFLGDLHRRAVGSAAVPLVNGNNTQYTVNITLGGQPFACIVDTGSTDLFVTGVVPSSQSIGQTANFSYGSGSVFGNIMEAPLAFASYNVPRQTFLSTTNSTGSGLNATGTGLIGLGPPIASVLLNQIDAVSAEPVMTNIFAQNLTSDNYITLFLSRDDDPESTAISQLTVSETLPGYESILQQTKLPLALNLAPEITFREPLYWKTYTDPNGILGPDGQVIALESQVPGAPNGTVVVTFDSGDTLPQVLPELASAIYSTVPGSIWNASLNQWTVPCTHELNLTFVFGGQKIFIHPLDLSATGAASGNPELDPVHGVAMCYGLTWTSNNVQYQPIQPGVNNSAFDMLIGMAFLRNVYILYDYGNMVFGSSTDRVPPFIKMLSITDPVEAHNDFVNVRLNNDSNAPLNGQIKPTEGVAGLSGGLSDTSEEPTTNGPWFYIVACVIGALVLSFGICVLAQRRRRQGNVLRYRDGNKPFLGYRKYRSMGAAVPVGMDEDENPQGQVTTMMEKGGSDEEAVSLTQAHYEDPFGDDADKS